MTSKIENKLEKVVVYP